MTVKNFVRIRTVFEVEKKYENGRFSVSFGVILAIFWRSQIQSYYFDVNAHEGALVGVK